MLPPSSRASRSPWSSLLRGLASGIAWTLLDNAVKHARTAGIIPPANPSDGTLSTEPAAVWNAANTNKHAETLMTGDKPHEVDERWMPEWIEFGMAELDVYLAKVAAFEVFYEHRPVTQEHAEEEPAT